jgi:hypothetical protein
MLMIIRFVFLRQSDIFFEKEVFLFLRGRKKEEMFQPSNFIRVVLLLLGEI